MNRIWLICLLLAIFAIVSAVAYPSTGISFQEQLRNLQRSYPNQLFPVERARRLLYTLPRRYEDIDHWEP